MSNIRVLETRRDQESQEAVKVLEDLLERARSGQFECVVVATVEHDGKIGMAWSETHQPGRRLGAAAWLNHCLADEIRRKSQCDCGGSE